MLPGFKKKKQTEKKQQNTCKKKVEDFAQTRQDPWGDLKVGVQKFLGYHGHLPKAKLLWKASLEDASSKVAEGL